MTKAVETGKGKQQDAKDDGSGSNKLSDSKRLTWPHSSRKGLRCPGMIGRAEGRKCCKRHWWGSENSSMSNSKERREGHHPSKAVLDVVDASSKTSTK